MHKLTITAKQIQTAIVRKYSSDVVLSNFYYGNWECDVFRLLSTGYIVEYEVKISRNDFFNDFEKERYKLNKHIELINGNESMCNRFYFVVPANLVSVDEIPKHCGLIYYDASDSSLKVVKNAKLLHKKEVSLNYFKKLAYKLYYRLADAKLNLPK